MSTIDPSELVLIGLDTADGPEHPLFDPSVTDPVDLDLARSLGERGQIAPVLVRKNGASLEVIAGRSRTKAARHWNANNPERAIKLAYTLRRGLSEVELLELVIAENEHRNDKPPIVKARMAQRLIDRGRTPAEVARLFRVTAQTIGNWLEQLDLAPEIQAALEAETISVNEAKSVEDLPHADQAAALQLAEAGGESLADVARTLAPLRKAGRRGGKRQARPPTDAPSRHEIRAVLEDDTCPDDAAGWRQALKWVLGDERYLFETDRLNSGD